MTIKYKDLIPGDVFTIVKEKDKRRYTKLGTMATVVQGDSKGTNIVMCRDELVVPLVTKKITAYELA